MQQDIQRISMIERQSAARWQAVALLQWTAAAQLPAVPPAKLNRSKRYTVHQHY
jgi:hypothetical protein